MMSIYSLAIKSLLNRKLTVLLTVAVISLSVTLLLGVERIRHEARNSFTSTISGTDLIVGARTGRIALLLSSVFHIGSAENSISWQSFEDVSKNPQVRWAIPLSLGDSHKGYRVLGTNDDYFNHFRYGRGRSLQLAGGQYFTDATHLVLGAEVAEKLGYGIGDRVVVSHGAGEFSFHDHDENPFTVVGILAPTGTPVDRTLIVDLAGIERIHADMPAAAGVGHDNYDVFFKDHDKHEHGAVPEQITAFLLGLKSRGAALSLQRVINTYKGEPLTAAMPGVTLQELWDAIGVAENALLAVAGFVVVVGLFGLLATLLTSINERRREMAILRSVGARPQHLFGLMVGEATLVTLCGVTVGVALLQLLLIIGQPLIASRFGLYLQSSGLSSNQFLLILLICACGALIGFIPGYRVYKYSLADGMTVKM
jgi:putative ABC transport system permease protein